MAPDALVREVLSRSTEIPLRIYNPESYDEERGAEMNGWETLARKWNKPALGTDVVSGMRRENFEAVHVWRDRVAREEDESTGYVFPQSRICSD
jgi:exosome complex exonuclease RRP6